MKILRNMLAAVAFLSVSVVGVAAQEDTDYSVGQVRELMKQPAGFSSSFSEKQVNRLGDRLSIALMKMYSGDDLRNPENIRRYLPLVENAFEFPNLIATHDREPRVTLVLLQFLRDRVTDKNLKAQILKTQKTILHDVGSIKQPGLCRTMDFV